MASPNRLDARLQSVSQALRRLRGPAKTALAWARYLFMPLAIGFIAFVAWSSRDLLGDVLQDARIEWLLAALALWLALHFVAPVFDRMILDSLEGGTSYATLRDIYLARLPTKYLPGGIWHNVTRLVDLNRAEVPRHQLTTLAILQIAIPVAVAFTVGGGLVFADQGSSRWGTIGALAAAAGAVALVATPLVLNRTALRGHAGLPAAGYLKGVASTVLFWALAAGAFYSYISAYSILPAATSLWDVAGAYLTAWGTGFISIVTPQGFGVFEATAAGILTTSTEFTATVAIIAGFRIVVLASDAVAWLGYQAFRRFQTAARD